MASVERVLILSIKAGAGHLRAAQALEAAFAESHPEVEVRHVEALELTNAAFRRSFTGSYNQLVAHLPSVWGMIYEQMERKPTTSKMKRLAALVDRLNSRRLLKEVAGFAPDRVICTHYLPAEILGRRRRKGKLDAPLFVTLTDYDIHVMWIQPGVDGYFVATDEMAYALRPEPPTVLVAAGGFGMGGVDATVAMLAEAADDVQLLAIAGRNEKLHQALQAVAKAHEGRIVPFGFVTNMHELMAASDFAVTKCGGLTSSECLAMGLPMVIVSPIPGQEERNADFLLEGGAALRANSSAHLLYKVTTLLRDERRLARMRTAARRIAKPHAAFDIVERVLAPPPPHV